LDFGVTDSVTDGHAPQTALQSQCNRVTDKTPLPDKKEEANKSGTEVFEV
jgi:hypothetical protein